MKKYFAVFALLLLIGGVYFYVKSRPHPFNPADYYESSVSAPTGNSETTQDREKSREALEDCEREVARQGISDVASSSRTLSPAEEAVIDCLSSKP